MKVIASWVAVLLLVVGAGVGIEGAAGVPSPAATLDRIAAGAAAAANDPHPPQVTWVETDRWGTRPGIGGPRCHGFCTPRPAPGPQTVYVLVMSGRFVLGPPSEAGTQQAPVFTTLVVVVNARTFAQETEMAFNGPFALGSYGAPETDTLR